MSKILVETDPSPMKLEVLGVEDWPVSEHGPGRSTHEYPYTETCYVIAGDARLTPVNGEPVQIREGDLVTLLPGLVCTWHVHTSIRSHVRTG